MTRNALILNKLNDLVATQTFILSGYGVRDADFRKVKVWRGITWSLASCLQNWRMG